MLVSQGEVQKRIEEVGLGNSGYKRQLRAPGISRERHERLQAEVALMEEELSTLEKIAQLGRVEEDRTKIETLVRDRLRIISERMSQESPTTGLQPEEYAYASGEVKALAWALGEDLLLQKMQQASSNRSASQGNPAQFNDSMTTMLIKALREGAERDTRASAAYDIGRLHLKAALPQLAAALDDHPNVASMALKSLALFSDDELKSANVPEEIRQQVSR